MCMRILRPLPALCLLLTALPALGLGAPALKWTQTPDLSPNGVDVNASYQFILADDFLCTRTGPIIEVHIWGSWFADEAAQPTFTLSFHKDVPANQSPTDYSMPGQVLWYRTFGPGEYTAEVYAAGPPEGWLTPPVDYSFPADTTCWVYRFPIDPADAFIQQEGTIYWLDVNALPDNPKAAFGWKSSESHWNDDAAWVEGEEPYSGLWNELRYPPGHQLPGQSVDLAFSLWMPPELDFGDAPDPTYPTYKINGGAYHTIVPNVFMGVTVDADPDGQPDLDALGDDNDGNDDEDGVVFITPIQTSDYNDAEVTVSVAGYLTAWIDFEQDGNWSPVGDLIYSGAVAAGTNTITFGVPGTAALGTTMARFRFCTTAPVPLDGPADDGEVEDYEVEIVRGVFPKWGQSPDYSTDGIDVSATGELLLADDFPCNDHGMITRVEVFGSWRNDYLPFQTDPEAVTFYLSIHADIPASESPTGYSMPGETLWWRQFDPGVFTAGIDSTGLREGWLYPPDAYFFPADTVCWKYTFEIPYEEAFEQLGRDDDPLVYWLGVKAVPLDGQASFGWKTSDYHYNDSAVWVVADEPYAGPWNRLLYPTGHYWEGFPTHLAFVIYNSLPPFQDMGDAPDPGYPTLLASDGARHDIVPGVALGDPFVDGDWQGQPIPPGAGDDTDWNDDEDGVSFLSALGAGAESRVEVTATVSGYLDAWVDFNRNGSWAEPEDRICGGLIPAGTSEIAFTCPATADSGLTYARFRFNTLGSLGFDGRALDGEVEDYGVFLSGATDAPSHPLPRIFRLYQSAPNPFSRSAEIRFDLPSPARVTLTLFGVDGCRVATLVDRPLPEGRHHAAWDGRDDTGRPVAAGVYYYRLRAGDFETTRKLILVR